MPSVKTAPSTDAGWVSNAQSPAANPLKRARRTGQPRRILSRLLARLNQMLKLSDFERGDIFRD